MSKRKGKEVVKPKEAERDGTSVHSSCKPPPTSASSIKDLDQVELELQLLLAFEFYPPIKLQGVHRHFVLYGLMEYLKRSFDRHFTAEEVLELVGRFYNIEMLKSDDDEIDELNNEEDFSLPKSFFAKDEP